MRNNSNQVVQIIRYSSGARFPMTNEPALIVRHSRFTLVIVVLLAALIAIAAIGITIELYHAQAAIALMLLPQIATLLAAYLAKMAWDRWAASSASLTVSAEGMTLPGVTMRPIPWTAVRSVRAVCSSPDPQHGAARRHYVFFDVDAPESFGVEQLGAMGWLAAPVPPGAPLLTLDLSELDTGRDAILGAVHRFHPAAVDAAPAAGASLAADVSLRFPTWREVTVAAHRLRIESATLAARRGEVAPAITRLARKGRTEAAALAKEIGAIHRNMVADARSYLQAKGEQVADHAGRALTMARATVLGVWHRVERVR